MVYGRPGEDWNLSDKPRFTEDEQAALRLMKAAGYCAIDREENGDLYALKDGELPQHLPREFFPSIQPGQTVEL